MSRIILIAFSVLFPLLLLGQDDAALHDSLRADTSLYIGAWKKVPFYRDSLANDTFFQRLFPSQSSYEGRMVDSRGELGDPVWRAQSNQVWRFWVILVLMACIGFVRLIRPGVVVTYVIAFFKPKQLSDVLENQQSEISGLSILMSLFTAMMYALPAQWMRWELGMALTDYPFGDYILIAITIFIFIVFRFFLAAFLGRVFESVYFVTTAIYASVCLNFFVAAAGIPAVMVIILNNYHLSEKLIWGILISLVVFISLVKSLKALFHASSGYAYPRFYLIVYLCTLEITPWLWVYFLVNK